MNFLALFLCFLGWGVKEDRQAEKQGYRVISEFGKTTINNFDCFVCGVGGGFLNNRANNLSIDFEFRHPYLIEEIRVIYINTLLDFIDFAMNDKKLRPYLNHVPLSIREVSLSLSFTNKERRKKSNCYVDYVGIGRGCKLFFSSDFGNDEGLEDVLRESIWDSIEIVRTLGKLQPYPWLDDWIIREKELQKEREAAGSW